MNKGFTILAIDDEKDITHLIDHYLSDTNYTVESANDSHQAKEMILHKKYDLIITDIKMPNLNGIKLMDQICKELKECPPFIFMTGLFDPSLMEQASKLGAVQILKKPIESALLKKSIETILERKNDKILDIMEIAKGISGVTLGKDKRNLVETRLLRRSRSLGLGSLDEYYEYFKKHREKEVKELVSVITTHTTHFFREKEHFDYLKDHFFPAFLKTKKKEISVWSCACSTGEEVYSIAMCFDDFLTSHYFSPIDKELKIKIKGSDIDFNVVEQAKKGIYKQANLQDLPEGYIQKYFNTGTGSLSGLIKIKNEIHENCSFELINLIGSDYPAENFDIIFLRNVLIYFEKEITKNILLKIKNLLNPGGILVLSHSESIPYMEENFENLGHSIYQLRKRTALKEETAYEKIFQTKPSQALKTSSYKSSEKNKDLILIGASTGGVEALKVVLQGIDSKCPPILIVQHIAEGFSKTLADRLNQACSIKVSEAIHGEVIEPSHAYLAPGGKQMKLQQYAGKLSIEITDDDPVNKHKPSVDYLFNHAVELAGSFRISAGIMTGMGADGASGLLALKKAGILQTIAQDEASSVVFGMPKVAIEMDAAQKIVSLDQFAAELLKPFCEK